MGWSEQLGESWERVLRERGEFGKPYIGKLQRSVKRLRINNKVYPEPENVFRAYRLTPYEDVKVLIVGQDPYHNGSADGLAFSSAQGWDNVPASLEKIFLEIERDIRDHQIFDPAPNPKLDRWAEQGVMLLNTSLTVNAGQPGSHRTLGWESFTFSTMQALVERFDPLVVMLWGRYAQELWSHVKYEKDNPLIHVIETSHPSPLSWKSGDNPFYGSGCFSRANKFLESYGLEPIDWIRNSVRNSTPKTEEGSIEIQQRKKTL